MHLRLFILLALLLLHTKDIAQVVITGTVSDANYDKVVSHGSIQILDRHDSTIQQYKLLDNEGRFSFSLSNNNPSDSVLIAYKGVDYGTEYWLYPAKTQTLNLNVQHLKTKLKPIVIKQPPLPIKRQGDTLSYDVDSFSLKRDRSLSDVLKHMPGIEVDDNGRIRYQGVPINKFYVEGMDLMQGRYGIVTNAMPNVDAAKVEVYQNHQPVKMLNGKVPTFQPAINIRLKKKISLSGRGEIGVGASPILWNAKLTPMAFTPKWQAVADLKLNNTGEDLLASLQSLTVKNGYDGLEIQQSLGQNIFNYKVPLPSQIKTSRYLRNNTQSVSINALKKLENDYELSINATYIHDLSKENGKQSTQVIADSQDTIAYARRSDYKSYTSHFDTRIGLAKNTDKFYLKDNLIFQVNANNNNSDVSINEDLVLQSMRQPSYSVQNTFSLLVPLDDKSKKLINIQSLISTWNDRQHYEVNNISGLGLVDSLFKNQYGIFQQYYQSRGWTSHQQISLPVSMSAITFIPSVGYDYSTDNRNTNFTHLSDIIAYSNKLDFHRNKFYGKMSVNYSKGSIRLAAIFPVQRYAIKASDPSHQLSKQLNKTTFEPDVNVSWKINNSWQWATSWNIQYQLASAGDLLIAPILNNLNINFNNPNIAVNRDQSIIPQINYADNIHFFFAYLSFSYIESNSNLTPTTSISSDGLSSTASLQQQNISLNRDWNLHFNKIIAKIKTNFSLNIGYRNNQNNQYLNNTWTAYKGNNQNIALIIENNKWNFVNLSYKISYGKSQQKSPSENNYTVNSWRQNGSVYLYPKDDHQIKLMVENSNFRLSSTPNQSNTFLDLSYQYTLKKKKIDFEISCQNLLNKKNYSEISIQNIYVNQLSYQLRPRQFLGTIKFNFR